MIKLTMSNVTCLLLILCMTNIRQVFSQCACPSGCQCNGATVTCNNIKVFPECLPAGSTRLTVYNSKNLTTISSIPKDLTYLEVTDTSVYSVSKHAIADASMLQTLMFSYNDQLRQLDLGEPSDGSHPLTTLNLTKCSVLSEVDNVKEYINLQFITISSCNLQEIDDDMFKGLRKVKTLDISHNHRLDDIDRDAFEDLDALESLSMNDCSLRKLYSEYFDNAYHKNLEYVNTLLNPLQCYKMCDFMQWYWGHSSFLSYAFIGSCTIQSYGNTYVYIVSDLNRYEAGCPTAFGVIIGATLGAFFFICIAACVFVVVCGIDYRKYCCFCCKSQRNRRNSSDNSSANQDQDHTYATAYQTQNEKAHINYPEGAMYTAAPPSYEDVTKAVDQEQSQSINIPEVASSSTT
ncbi:uncharacterized protein LOC120327539 [Styela clava]